ncbi:MAG: bifunctional phosphopantothenoylcysteine decarboxylase/phosphopantothenate--cysteine ligase CoaBC [Cyclobacteriaceae bacterium]
MLRSKKIILGVSGSIAAYKSAVLTRLLVQSGAGVKVIMTAPALDFITPLTLATLSKNPVLTEFSNPKDGTWNNHVELGLWADAMIIAPASANTLAALAGGLCSNILQAVYLSARCPIFIAPAMDADMYLHPATQRNLQTLISDGNTVIDPEVGELASGLSGPGRMAEPEKIVEQLNDFFSQKRSLKGKKALVTAGPTYEALDPVRFIGNYSSGKMGYAIADVLADQGADVTLVSGPVYEKVKNQSVKVIRCVSAAEMNSECQKVFPGTEITVMAAAVADYRPEHVATEKIKKSEKDYLLNLTRTPDIAAGLGAIKKPGQILAGFALETENGELNAREKMMRKGFDFIVLNSLKDEGAGFGFDTNRITILDKDGKSLPFGLKSKHEVACDIVNFIVEKINA